MHELVSLLTRERLLIERVLYRVTNMRNLLVGGQARFLAWAADEVEAAADALRDLELTRAVAYQELVDTLGLPETFDWEPLIEAASETDAVLLRSLRSDIGSLNSELRGHLAACRTLSEAGVESAAAALARLQGVDLSVAASPSIESHRHIHRDL